MEQSERDEFFGEGFFDWQKALAEGAAREAIFRYDEDQYWGGFSHEPFDPDSYTLPDWAIGPFMKYEGNPILGPSKGEWDGGRYGGGVHNGSIVVRDGTFYYIYRGEHILEPPVGRIDYVCDIGIARSDDGVHFTKDRENSPFFRHGEDKKYSFEDVNIVEHEGTYHLFCNRWDWTRTTDPSVSGAFQAVSDDLIHWEKVGLIFPDANEIHRNPVVLQNPHAEAVQAGGRFVMYINNGIMAYSDDLLHWKSSKLESFWPGGEGCMAMADYTAESGDDIVLFTGGHHTGHFYAIGEVLLSKADPGAAREWLPRPIIHAEPDKYPWEDGLSARPPHQPVSYWKDTIFFNGLTKHDSKWWMYYGGSEFYTCLATAKARD